MEKEWLEIVLKDGSSALIKNISGKTLLNLQQLACEEKIVLEACQRDGKFFDVKVDEIKSWRKAEVTE